METIIFTGLQGAGKSSFYKERFFNTHLRINLDQIRTRHRERLLLNLCLETQQPCVIDNTNPDVRQRSEYISQSRKAGFRVTGYYFQSRVETCLRRNQQRISSVPDVAILGTARKLEIPSVSEGFDELWYVKIENQSFVVERWNDEV